MDILPATSLDGQPIADSVPGPVTKKLAESLAEIVQEELRLK